MGVEVRAFSSRGTRKSIKTSALSEKEGRDYLGSGLIPVAIRKMTDVRLAQKIASINISKVAGGEEQKGQVEEIKVHLGHYWKEPREVFARLVEQYVANIRGEGVSCRSPQFYAETPAYWKQEIFTTLQPMIAQEIADRIKALRDVGAEQVRAPVSRNPVSDSTNSTNATNPLPDWARSPGALLVRSAKTQAQVVFSRALVSGGRLAAKFPTYMKLYSTASQLKESVEHWAGQVDPVVIHQALDMIRQGVETSARIVSNPNQVKGR